MRGAVSIEGPAGPLDRDELKAALFWSVIADALESNIIVQGVLLGGLYALFAAGLFADLRCHGAGQCRAWRSDRSGCLHGLFCRRAHGVLGPFMSLLIVLPIAAGLHRLCPAACSVESDAGRGPASLCSSLSASRSSSRMDCSRRCSPPTAAECRPAHSRLPAGESSDELSIGLLPLTQFLCAVAVIASLQVLVLPDGPGPRFSGPLSR